MGFTNCRPEDFGLFATVEKIKRAFPCEGTHISARVVGLVAEVQVVQFYVNHSHTPLNAKYSFPLDESAGLCGFEAELGDRLLIGEVKEKEEARREYAEAKKKGQTALLLEQDKPDVFHQYIANIPPLARVNVRVTYVTDLKVDEGGAVQFFLPTALAPRYTPYTEATRPTWCPPGGEGDYSPILWTRPWISYCISRAVLLGISDHGSYHPPIYWYGYLPDIIIDIPPFAFSMTLEVQMPSPIVEIRSGTHEIKVDPSEDPQRATVSFWSPQLIEKDLVVLISQRAPHSPEIVVEVAADGSGCAMLTMVPEFDLDPEPAEIVFLVDCSGSMDLHRISAARQALGVFLRSLPISCRFNLVKFGSRYHSLFPAMSTQPYTAASFQKAANYISGITATYGGTDIATPLREIFRQPVSPGYSRQLFVLTDGEVSNTEAVIELCRTNARNTRVFSVGIGEEVSHHLVEGMARASSGTAVFIQGRELTDSSLGVFESKLITLLKAATLPSITKISVDWGHLGPVVAPVLPAAPEGSCSSSAAAIPPLDYYTHLPNSLAPAAASDPSLQSLSSQTLQAPFLPPPLFSGSKFVLFAFFPPGQLPVSHATLTAQAPGGQLNIDIPVTLLKSGGRTLHLLAARALIRDLEEGFSPLHWKKMTRPAASKQGGDGSETGEFVTRRWFTGWIGGPAPVAVGGAGQDKASQWGLEPITPDPSQVRKELVRLALKFGLSSSATSFVAVERWLNGTEASSVAPLPGPAASVQASSMFSGDSDEDEYNTASSEDEERDGGYGGQWKSSEEAVQDFSSSFQIKGSKLKKSGRGAVPVSLGRATSPVGGRRGGGGGGGGEGSSLARPSQASAPGRGRPALLPAAKKLCAPPAPSGGPPPLSSSSSLSAAPPAPRDVMTGASKGLALKDSSPTSVSSSTSASISSPSSAAAEVPQAVVCVPLELLMTQQFDGSFAPSPQLLSVLGKTAEQLDAGVAQHQSRLQDLSADTANMLWATVVVIAMLKTRWGAFEDAWHMAAEKARNWCVSILASQLHLARPEARTFLQSLVSSV